MSKYHVALSFAGEDRPYVEQVAARLRAEGVDVFYDLFEEATLWGKDLYVHLSDVYQNMALFTVMFISEDYRSKLWPTHERRSAQARAFSDSQEYILPAFFDDTIEVPGLLKTTGYVSLKGRTPEDLASLIVTKLEESGVVLARHFAYAEDAKADVDFPLSKDGVVSDIVRGLRSYTWGTQHPAVVNLLELDWTEVSLDEAFVLGRNLYQTACGGERQAGRALNDLRRELATLPIDRAHDLLNGMLFEVYFDSQGEFRGHELKARYLPQLLRLQTVEKYSPSIAFIRRVLDPYRSSLLILPNTVPEKIAVELIVKRSAPPTIKHLKVQVRDVLTADPNAADGSSRIWRLAYQEFSIAELHRSLAEEWGVPEDQMEINCSAPLGKEVKLRLPEGLSIAAPGTL